MKCFDCESINITTIMVEHRVPYGIEPVEVIIKVPVRKCLDCDNMWMDHEAEDIISNTLETL